MYTGKSQAGWLIEYLLLTQVLEAEPSNVKALFRRAHAHLAQQDFLEAELDIRAALLVRPHPALLLIASAPSQALMALYLLRSFQRRSI